MPNFSGMWTLQAQMQAIAAGNWELPPSNLYVWGQNNNGQLGQNDVVNRSSPVQLGAGKVWAQTASGANFSLAVKTDGTLWSWGYNSEGSLGLNDTIRRSSPVQVGALTDWSKVSANTNLSAAIKTNGTLWTWGRNQNGQLGQNDRVYRSSPTQVGSLTDWAQVSAGQFFCAAIKTNGTLWTWGFNQYGRLGQNISYLVYRSSPVQVGALTDWSKVDTGGGGTFCGAIKTNGTLWSWGQNSRGQLGQNNLVNRSSPVQVGALTDWSQVSAVLNSFSAIKTNGTLWTWGDNQVGQLGQNISVTVYRSSPVQVGALTDWSKIAGNMAIKTNGTLWSWGANSIGQLGQNDVVGRSSPVQVGALTNWSTLSLSSNGNSSLVITT